jgi:hypothetical protein
MMTETGESGCVFSPETDIRSILEEAGVSPEINDQVANIVHDLCWRIAGARRQLADQMLKVSDAQFEADRWRAVAKGGAIGGKDGAQI